MNDRNAFLGYGVVDKSDGDRKTDNIGKEELIERINSSMENMGDQLAIETIIKTIGNNH